MSEPIVSVEDFLKEGTDPAAAIANAVGYAEKHGISMVFLKAGTYRLKAFKNHKTASIAHDDGCGDIDSKDCHILLQNLKGITLKGERNKDGSPATILVGSNSRTPQALLPSILWAEGCRDLTLQDLAFTRDPECAATGVITDVADGSVTIETPNGVPCYDDMPAYCMNRFDPSGKKLLGESLTFGFGFDKRWKKAGTHTLTLRDPRISGMVHVGERLSFHQAGKTDFLLFFGGCKRLSFQNIRICNTNSYAVLTENCDTVTADGLVIKPRGGQLFTGPRDGWKIYRCTGTISVTNCHIEGVRMDGQNVHNNFMILKEVLSPVSAVFACKYAPIPLEKNTGLELYDGTVIVARHITGWEITGRIKKPAIQESGNGAAAVVGTQNIFTLYELHFKEPLPSFAKEGTLGVPRCWEPVRYACRDTSFLNIAGAGQLLRCGNAVIEHCSYENIMNAGILLGAELSTHCEGGHATNVVISRCTFTNCGFKPRYETFGCGCIAVKSQGFDGPYNKNITIEDNLFQDSGRALEIRDADGLYARRNRYVRIGERILLDRRTTKNVSLED